MNIQEINQHVPSSDGDRKDEKRSMAVHGYRSYLSRSLVLFVLLLSSSTALYAFTMSEYFPLTAGNSWIFGRTFFLVSSEIHDFSGKTEKHFLDAKNYNDILYLHDTDGTVSIVGSKEGDGPIIDVSDTPGILVSAEMNVGDNVVSVIPAGKFGPNSITITSTLVQLEPTLTVPAGTFTNTLKIQLVIDEVTYSYTENIWLAKNIGPVKITRGSYTPHDGACLFTCGCFDFDFEVVETLSMELTSYHQSSFSDTDGDGVIDVLDDCVNTPTNSLVDSKGCPAKPKVVILPPKGGPKGGPAKPEVVIIPPSD